MKTFIQTIGLVLIIAFGAHLFVNPPIQSQETIELVQPNSLKWWHDAVTYQVWVRSFQDSDGDGVGDLAGLTSKLDYLKSLGVNTLWLSPIFESPSYHGYDTSNFYLIAPDLGSMDDYYAFIGKAKAKGMHIILDIAFNHVSEYHPWFQKSLTKETPFDDYFVWKKNIPGNYGRPWSDVEDPTAVWHKKPERDDYYYGVFGWTQPDLNLKNIDVKDEINHIASFWLNKGVDGFRLDAVRYLIEDGGIGKQADTSSTHKFLKDFTAHVKSVKPDAWVIGEAADNTRAVARYYKNGKSIDSTFDFAFGNVVASSLDRAPINQETKYREKMQRQKASLHALWDVFKERAHAKVPSTFYAAFLNGHDSDRLAHSLNGNMTQAKIAASLLLTAPYAPFLYYGEEIGMTQKDSGDDMYRRALMQWDDSANAGFNQTGNRWLDDADTFYWLKDFTPWWKNYWQNLPNKQTQTVSGQINDPRSLLAHYQQLIQLRKDNPIIRQPDSIHLINNFTNVWLVRYTKGQDNLWIVINLDSEQDTVLELPEELTGTFTNLISQQPINLAEKVTMDKGQIMVLKTK